MTIHDRDADVGIFSAVFTVAGYGQSAPLVHGLRSPKTST